MKQLHAVLINVEFCGAAGLSIEFVIEISLARIYFTLYTADFIKRHVRLR